MWPSASSTGSTAQTVASWPLSVAMHEPSFQTLTVLSHDAESSVPAAAEYLTHDTVLVCPSSTREGMPVARSHSMTCLSLLPEAAPPLGPDATAIT